MSIVHDVGNSLNNVTLSYRLTLVTETAWPPCTAPTLVICSAISLASWFTAASTTLVVLTWVHPGCLLSCSTHLLCWYLHHIQHRWVDLMVQSGMIITELRMASYCQNGVVYITFLQWLLVIIIIIVPTLLVLSHCLLLRYPFWIILYIRDSAGRSQM